MTFDIGTRGGDNLCAQCLEKPYTKILIWFDPSTNECDFRPYCDTCYAVYKPYTESLGRETQTFPRDQVNAAHELLKERESLHMGVFKERLV